MSRVYSNYKNQHDLPFLFKIIFDVFGELAKHTSTISAATYSNFKSFDKQNRSRGGPFWSVNIKSVSFSCNDATSQEPGNEVGNDVEEYSLTRHRRLSVSRILRNKDMPSRCRIISLLAGFCISSSLRAHSAKTVAVGLPI